MDHQIVIQSIEQDMQRSVKALIAAIGNDTIQVQFTVDKTQQYT